MQHGLRMLTRNFLWPDRRKKHIGCSDTSLPKVSVCSCLPNSAWTAYTSPLFDDISAKTCKWPCCKRTFIAPVVNGRVQLCGVSYLFRFPLFAYGYTKSGRSGLSEFTANMGSMFLCTMPNIVVPSFKNVHTWRFVAVSETRSVYDRYKFWLQKEDVRGTKMFIAWLSEHC